MAGMPRVRTVAMLAAIALIAVPATAFADCTPACGGEIDQGLDPLGIVLLVAVLTVFAAVMTLGGRILRKDRRSTD